MKNNNEYIWEIYLRYWTFCFLRVYKIFNIDFVYMSLFFHSEHIFVKVDILNLFDREG